jgi:glycosyltransferase involved in cell wall biosynthesis
MRILFLSQWFHPEPSIKGLAFAKALIRKGHRVEVLTGFPNYPGGKIYPGYRIHLHQVEQLEGVTIHRVALYPSHGKSAFGRILNYLSFSTIALLLGPWLAKKPDIVYVYNLVTLAPLALLLRTLFGSKVILDVQDLWPESVANAKMIGSAVVLRALNAFCRWAYRKVDQLVVLSPGFKVKLVGRGVAPAKIKVIYNWFDESSACRAEASTDNSGALGCNGKYVILFAGTMGTAQGLDCILDCARICKNSLPQVQFVLVGAGVERPHLIRRAGKMGLDNVAFLPPRPMESMGEIYAASDVLLVHLRDDPLFQITIPSKTQAYLYMGKPILMAVRGDAAELIRKANAGIVCEPENPAAMAGAIEKLISMSREDRNIMGASGARYYMTHLSFASGVRQFEQLMRTVREAAGSNRG